MTSSEAIIAWLKSFNPIDYWQMKEIDTDLQSAEVDTYSLVKEPVQNVKSYLSGKKMYTVHYMIQARLSSQNDSDRIDNNGFGEALEAFVAQKNQQKVYPAIPDAQVQKISTTTPFYMGRTETNNSVYRMTISIQYMKEA